MGVAVWCFCACLVSACVGASAPEARHAEATPAGGQVKVAPMLVATMRRISVELARQGLVPDAHAFAGFLPGGNHATFPVHVPADTCLTIVAIATKNVSDVDAALYTPEGDLVVVDSEPDPHPTLQVCSGKTASDLYYVMQLYDGDGSFVVLSFFGTRASLPAAARVIGGRPAFAEAAPLRDTSEDPLLSLREGMHKRGFTQALDPIVFPIAQQERIRTGLPIAAATCYTVAAFGSEGVQDLGLRVLDDHGVERSVGEGARGQAALQMCAHDAGSYVVETQARDGAGQVTLVVFRATAVATGGETGLWLGQRTAAKTN